MTQTFICDAIRTPFGRYDGSLSTVRANNPGSLPIKALMQRDPNVDWAAVTDVLYGYANQAGEDNRNVARMAALLAGLPMDAPGATINRLCGSGLDAVGSATRTIKAGEAGLMTAGGVESMSRAPFTMPKAETAFTYLHLGEGEVAAYLDMDRTTALRKAARDEPLPTHVAEGLLRLLELERMAADTFTTPEKAEQWLRRPYPMLDDEAPLVCAKSAFGAQRVKDILVALKYGGVV